MGSFVSRVTPSFNKSTITKSKTKYFSYFDILSAQRFFVVGTYHGYDDDLLIQRFSDLDILNYKKGVKILSIYFYHFESILIGYEAQYLDFQGKAFDIVRVPNDFNRFQKFMHKKGEKLILANDEHIVDLELTFTYDHVHISSIYFKTTKGQEKRYGKITENTSISKVDENNNQEINVIFGFEGCFSKSSLKELFVVRGGAIMTSTYHKKIPVEKYDELKGREQGVVQTPSASGLLMDKSMPSEGQYFQWIQYQLVFDLPFKNPKNNKEFEINALKESQYFQQEIEQYDENQIKKQRVQKKRLTQKEQWDQMLENEDNFDHLTDQFDEKIEKLYQMKKDNNNKSNNKKSNNLEIPRKQRGRLLSLTLKDEKEQKKVSWFENNVIGLFKKNSNGNNNKPDQELKTVIIDIKKPDSQKEKTQTQQLDTLRTENAGLLESTRNINNP